MAAAGAEPYALTERRIAILTLVLGAVAAVASGLLISVRVGAGVLIGAILAWVNFRFLERAMDSITHASTAQQGSPEARVPVLSYFGLFARYALIAGVVYVIFSRFKIPVLSILAGLCALGAATIAATLFEILSPADRRSE
jgi:small-conductance mechanosensitive channel